MTSFTLTQVVPHVTCFGTSFPSLEAAHDYAISLRTLGLCEEFCIGEYRYTGHEGVFDSRKDQYQPRNPVNWQKEGF